MYVKDHMTKNPITITGDVSVSKALDIMAKNDFHRLPVVDENQKIKGLLTEGLVSESSGRSTTSLSIYELNYLLSKTKASEIMITDVVTVSPDLFLEEAAAEMLKNKISVLPVVDEEQKVIGIITEKDIFDAFIRLMGYRTQGTRFIIKCNDVPGEFLKIAKLFAEEDANLENLAVYRSAERGVEVVVKATGLVPVDTMTNILEGAGFEVLRVIQTDHDGNRIFHK